MQPRYDEANHNPTMMVNGTAGPAPLTIVARSGATATLDTAGSSDPDGNAVAFRWIPYREAGAVTVAGGSRIVEEAPGRARVVLPKVDTETDVHVVVERKDDASLPLFGYRRVVIRVRRDAGGGQAGATAVANCAAPGRG